MLRLRYLPMQMRNENRSNALRKSTEIVHTWELLDIKLWIFSRKSSKRHCRRKTSRKPDSLSDSKPLLERRSRKGVKNSFSTIFEMNQ